MEMEEGLVLSNLLTVIVFNGLNNTSRDVVKILDIQGNQLCLYLSKGKSNGLWNNFERAFLPFVGVYAKTGWLIKCSPNPKVGEKFTKKVLEIVKNNDQKQLMTELTQYHVKICQSELFAPKCCISDLCQECSWFVEELEESQRKVHAYAQTMIRNFCCRFDSVQNLLISVALGTILLKDDEDFYQSVIGKAFHQVVFEVLHKDLKIFPVFKIETKTLQCDTKEKATVFLSKEFPL